MTGVGVGSAVAASAASVAVIVVVAVKIGLECGVSAIVVGEERAVVAVASPAEDS
jgi:hypothetical protein